MSVLIGNGDGTFRALAIYQAGTQIITCHLGVLDRDADKDLVCPGGAVPAVVLFHGRGDGTFDGPRQIPLA